MGEITPLGRRLLDLLEQRRFSMRAASLAAGLSENVLSQWIHNPAAGRPKPENLKAIAEVLGADYTELWELAGHPLPPNVHAEPGQLRLLVDRLRALANQSPERAQIMIDAILLWLEASEVVSNAGALDGEEVAEAVPGPTPAQSGNGDGSS